jgi:D-tyrosyl-tRNA(Tyr) deacylase
MKILIQRVSKASVEVNGQIIGSIASGALVFIGITLGDKSDQSSWLATKLANLRIFVDDQGKLNESLLDQRKEVLIVSQFTLYADCSEGRRPSFTQAACPELARPLYEHFIAEVKKLGLPVQTGIFGANMQVALVNDGPITLLIERSQTTHAKIE